ncbi:endonuclease/exonuclease/phosphatase family protein [Metamycoplasma subdolum]|uniref:endonuclease/exonuclease/phosphatase family protein n=1 Tax=Metamycoplasma subdolum TaxID=92407 RepID=UPI0011C3841E|nr:endonuclease/exonuclease/phosphatase family protein [Metamycoplasma subdolum]WPB50492.1 endonuclease/exonuclease/phosphatase family protein [Metamycoplasma subdolum]
MAKLVTFSAVSFLPVVLISCKNGRDEAEKRLKRIIQEMEVEFDGDKSQVEAKSVTKKQIKITKTNTWIHIVNLNLSVKSDNTTLQVKVELIYHNIPQIKVTRIFEIAGFKSTGTVTPPPVPTPPPSGKSSIVWGHWNVLNLSDGGEEYKHRAIAQIINGEKFDLIGLTEIRSTEGAERVLDLLKEINSSNFNIIHSELLKGSYASPGQAEYVSIIYNSDKLKTLPFENGKTGFSYTETFDPEEPLNESNGGKGEYVRPPFGVKFAALDHNKNQVEDFTFIFDHFDSPGGKGGEGSKNGTGLQELAEARQLKNVFKKYDEIDGTNSDLFFGGDTNIKFKKQDFAFNMTNEFKFLFEEIEENKTSLGMKPEVYSNTYDKLIAKTNLKTESGMIHKLWSINNEQINTWKALFKKWKISFPTEETWPRTVSDHCAVSSKIIY